MAQEQLAGEVKVLLDLSSKVEHFVRELNRIAIVDVNKRQNDIEILFTEIQEFFPKFSEVLNKEHNNKSLLELKEKFDEVLDLLNRMSDRRLELETQPAIGAEEDKDKDSTSETKSELN